MIRVGGPSSPSNHSGSNIEEKSAPIANSPQSGIEASSITSQDHAKASSWYSPVTNFVKRAIDWIRQLLAKWIPSLKVREQPREMPQSQQASHTVNEVQQPALPVRENVSSSINQELESEQPKKKEIDQHMTMATSIPLEPVQTRGAFSEFEIAIAQERRNIAEGKKQAQVFYEARLKEIEENSKKKTQEIETQREQLRLKSEEARRQQLEKIKALTQQLEPGAIAAEFSKETDESIKRLKDKLKSIDEEHARWDAAFVESSNSQGNMPPKPSGEQKPGLMTQKKKEVNERYGLRKKGKE